MPTQSLQESHPSSTLFSTREVTWQNHFAQQIQIQPQACLRLFLLEFTMVGKSRRWLNIKLTTLIFRQHAASIYGFVCSFRFVTFRFVKKKCLSKRPSSYCLIHFEVSSGAARRRKKTFSTVRIRMGKLAWVSALQFWAQHNYDKTRNNGMSVNFAIWYFKQYTDGALWASTTE